MKRTFKTLFLSLFLLIALFANFAFSQEQTRRSLHLEYRKFLVGLGFEDYSKMIRENRKAKTGIGAISESVLKFNQSRYEIFNYSRDLAILLTLRLHEEPKLKEKIAALNAKLLNLQPIEPPTKFPDSVLAVKGTEALEEAKIAYIVEVTKKNIKDHTRAVISDIYNSLYGEKFLKDFLASLDIANPTEAQTKFLKELERIENLTRKIVEFTYLDTEMGHTRFLGRALTANLYRYAKINNDKEFLTTIKEAAKTEGVKIENYIGATLYVPNKSGHLEKIAIQNGDFLMERSIGKEAGQITWGARPGIQNTIRAASKRLLGNIFGEMLPIEDLETAELSTVEYARMKLSEKPIMTRGFSHVGIANVLEDEETGIKMLWALDNYPNALDGGIRISGVLDQFSYEGPYLKLGVSRYDSEKFWEFAQEQIKENGYNETAWVGEKEFLDADGITIDQKEITPDEWKTTISKEDFSKLNSVPKSEAKKWHEEVNKKITEHIRHKMLTEDGVGFAYGFSNFKGRTYCSQTILIAAKQSTGLELQPIKDRWNLGLKLMKKLGVESAKDVRTDLRIIAASGFAWQPLVGFNAKIEYPDMNVAERNRAGLISTYLEENRKTTDLLLKVLHEKNPSGRRMSVYESSLGEAIELAMQGELTKSQKIKPSQHAGATISDGYINNCSKLLRK